ncbi:putative reverse transcriptase domain-containing protein, partial [Tanacetum coccineum]
TMPNTRSGALRTREGINEQIDHQMTGALGARMEEMEMEEIEMEEMEIDEIEMEEMEMVMGTEEEMAITSEDLCMLEKKYQVKYATCTLLNRALTWWNSHKRTIGIEAAYAMSWVELMKLMTEVYCLINEVQKMDTELWNLVVKGNNLTDYTRRFQELVLLCTRMVPNEEDKVERFVGGLPDNIQGNIIADEPIELQDAIRIANNLMDQKLRDMLEVLKTKEGWITTQETIVDNNQFSSGKMLEDKMWQELIQLGTMRKRGHFRKDCPKLRNQNRGNKTGNKNGNKTGNQTRGNEATAKAYAIGGEGANPDSKQTPIPTFALLDVTPSTLDTSYAVELADGRISETNVVLRGRTLGLLGHPFDIDLMLVELGSFDVIIGVDWLAK